MNHHFTPGGFFRAPDGTDVAELIHRAGDGNLAGELSVALGHIAPGVCSAIHCHPVVTQVTLVTSGSLTVKMRAPAETAPERVDARAGDAVLTPPLTLLQLCNETRQPVSVAYVVKPGYLRKLDAQGNAVFDDAVIVGPSWDQLDLEALNADQVVAFKVRRRALCDSPSL